MGYHGSVVDLVGELVVELREGRESHDLDLDWILAKELMVGANVYFLLKMIEMYEVDYGDETIKRVLLQMGHRFESNVFRELKWRIV